MACLYWNICFRPERFGANASIRRAGAVDSIWQMIRSKGCRYLVQPAAWTPHTSKCEALAPSPPQHPDPIPWLPRIPLRAQPMAGAHHGLPMTVPESTDKKMGAKAPGALQ